MLRSEVGANPGWTTDESCQMFDKRLDTWDDLNCRGTISEDCNGLASVVIVMISYRGMNHMTLEIFQA